MHKVKQMTLKPGLEAFYTIRPGNRLAIFYSSQNQHGQWARLHTVSLGQQK